MVIMKYLSFITTLIMICTTCTSATGSEWQGIIDDDKDCNRPSLPSDTDNHSEPIRIGIFTDAHYSATKDNTAERFYRNSRKKIASAVQTFNESKVDMVLSLGDIVDNDYDDYEDIGRLLDQLNMPVYKVLGNHDFVTPFSEEQQKAAIEVLGISERYFSIVKGSIRLIFLDSSDIATYSHPLESTEYREAAKILATLKDDLALNAKKYNGAIGQEQMSWLEDQLKEASSLSQTAICFLHIPLAIAGAEKYTLWNGEDVTDLLSGYPCAKAVIAGHHHAGGYSSNGGLHHITLKGMVQGEETSYSIFEVYRDRIKIDGFGRENDIEYKF